MAKAPQKGSEEPVKEGTVKHADLRFDRNNPRSGDRTFANECYSACKIDPLSRGIGVQN
jgi:hypothetical protein